MGSIVITLGGVSVLCAAGFGISTVFKWFHEYEVDVAGRMRENRKQGREVSAGPRRRRRGGAHSDRINHLHEEVRQGR